jgi:4-amino-4-deoxy-L-arabinose transferase-like glycosyltransferase
MTLGDGIVYARLLSVILGVINVYQVLVIGRRLGGIWFGLGGALLLAVNPMHVWYSQEIRQYMLLTVLMTESMSAFWSCLQGKQRWLSYGLFTVLSFYTHYFTVFIVTAHALLAVVWTFWQGQKTILRTWFLTILGVGLCFLPWLPTAINQFLYHTMPWIGEPEAGEVRDIPERLLLGSGILILPDWLRWLGLAAFVGLITWLFWVTSKKKIGSMQVLIFVSSWALIPYLLISATSFFYPIFQFKQFLMLLPAFVLLAVLLVSSFPGRWRALAYICLLMLPVFTLGYQQATLSKDDWHGLADYVEMNFEGGDIVYSNPAGASLALDLYLTSPIPLKGYPPDFNILTGGWEGETLTSNIGNQQLSTISENVKRLWLVEFFPEFWDPDRLLPTLLEEQATLLDNKWFGNIHLRLYQIEPISP